MNSNNSVSTIQRLPIYLRYIKNLEEQPLNISSAQIAQGLHMGEVLVRKDLASICNKGRPKVGYDTKELISVLESYLGYDKETKAVVIGVGKLGQALMNYSGFEEYGLKIVCGFDIHNIDNKVVYSLDKLKDMIKSLDIKIAILTVPSNVSQEIVDILNESEIQGIWNFTTAHIVTNSNIAIKNENLAGSLAVLSNQINKINE